MTSKEKRKICNACPNRVSTRFGDKCGACGCLVAVRIMSGLKCPVGKW